jgi:hypothetical protein
LFCNDVLFLLVSVLLLLLFLFSILFSVVV